MILMRFFFNKTDYLRNFYYRVIKSFIFNDF